MTSWSGLTCSWVKTMRNDNPLGIDNVHRPLFETYPGLKSIPWLPLMDGLPTPVQRLDAISSKYPGFDVFVKRDDLTSSIYGGNKPRKFEFLFGDAVAKKKNAIHTAGGTGTNHGLATALFCKALGLQAKIYVFDQPLTWSVQRKLLMYAGTGAKLQPVPSYGVLSLKGLGQLLFHPRHYLILPGGSPLFGIGTVAGCLGFVNAALELKEQVDSGTVTEPDVLFVPAGSTGSASGLVLGCKLAGLKTRVIAIPVSELIVANTSAITRNARKTLSLMRKHDASVPRVHVRYPDDFGFQEGYLGSAYGCVTAPSQAAVDLVARLEGDKGFHLETTYTGKACAAMLAFMAREQDLGGETTNVMFWNTYNSRDLTPLVKESCFELDALPAKLKRLFDQPLCCWRLNDCPAEKREVCDAYLAEENRCWMVTSTPSGCEGCETKAELAEMIKPEP